jgi:hypothetical protein
MPPTPENVEDVSPYKLLRNFSKSRLLRCLFLALLIHAAVICGLSTDYIYRTWINPEAGPTEQDAAANVEDAEGPPGEGAREDPATGAKGPGSDEKGGPAEGGGASQEAPVVNRVTGKADPEELPDEPGGLGISIDDVKD